MNPSLRPLIQELWECRETDLAGGKAVNLGVLVRGGFKVPPGFVVTTEGYQRGASDQELIDQVRRAYRKLGSPAVAVRSSATAEDLFEASLAGQYETFLDVRGEEALLDAIRCCWASLDSPRVTSYLAEHGIDRMQIAMAVVVQKLVKAEVAGVLFSANPRTGSRKEMVVEASWGLGEAVVSGRVQPDVFLLERDGGQILEARIADKQVMVGGGQERPVEEGRRRTACLGAEDVAELWKLGLKAEESFGGPQDVEWAIEAGQVYLLQSRPITTLEQAEAYERLLSGTRLRLRELLKEGRGPWVRHNLAETLKHPTPLTWSVIKRFMSGSGGFGAMYRMAGYAPSARVCAEGFLERIGGQIYMDVSRAGEMFCDKFPFAYDLDELRWSPDASQSPPTVATGALHERLAARARIARAHARLNELAGTLEEELVKNVIPEFVDWCAQEKRRELAELGREELIEVWRARQRRVMDEFAPKSLLPSLIGALALAELERFLAEHLWDDEAGALAAEMSSGGEGDLTLKSNGELFEVAQGKRTVEAWVETHGHRAPDEFDLATPRWRERRQELMEMAGRLRGGADPQARHDEHVAKVNATIEQVQGNLDARAARELNERVALCRRYLRFREDGKYYLMLGYELLRDVAVEAGGRLEVHGDVFYLTEEELIDALRVGVAPAVLIAQRKTEFAAEGKLSLPFLIDGAALDSLGQSGRIDGADVMAAFALSAGVAKGEARIVKSPGDAGELGRGYVLVCPSTDPNWTPLFVNAAGLVLECGGTLSHGAVVAREMNLPAVVLPGATTRVSEGEMITVDGNAGAVIRAGGDASVQTDRASDVKVSRRLMPPVEARRERQSARLRNWLALLWGVYLLAAWLLPEAWVHDPTMRALDMVLWPLVRGIGKPGTVAVIAAAMAVLTMVMQCWMTDNARLREAKRRAKWLEKEAAALPQESARKRVLERLIAPVQARIVAAAMVPLAVLLGPMVMVFLWLPARVDVAAWNAAPGTKAMIVAKVHERGKAATIRLGEPVVLAEGKISQTPPAIRAALEEYRRELLEAGPQTRTPIEGVQNELVRQELLADLEAYLKRGVPAQPLRWDVQMPAAPGKWPVEIAVEGEQPLRVELVAGDVHPPAEKRVMGDGGTVESVTVTYPRPKYKQMFWRRFPGTEWEIGWLSVYLAVYIPVMIAAKKMLGVV